MKSKIFFTLLVVCAVLGFRMAAADAEYQPQERTTKDGIYTEEQANRGADLIRQIGCANCHGSTLEGGPCETPSLIGNSFLQEWVGQTANDMAIKVSSMPPDHRDVRKAQDNVDILSLLLAINGYPAGNTELSSDPEVLKRIKVVFP